MYMIGDLVADDSKLSLRRRQGELESVNGRARWLATSAYERHALY